jgi:hypothetical protein
LWGVAQLEMAELPLTLANRTTVLFSDKTKVIHNLKKVSVGKNEETFPMHRRKYHVFSWLDFALL